MRVAWPMASISLDVFFKAFNTADDLRCYDFHIHTATERYQEAGYAEEHYAETTNRYADLSSAIQCMLQDCAFELPPGTQSL